MEARKRDIEIYRTLDGRVPYIEWLESLGSDQVKAVVTKRIDRVMLGNMGDCKSIGGGALELRIDYGPGYRVYIGQDGPKLVILLTGGDKSTQKGDIKLAKALWKEYKGR